MKKFVVMMIVFCGMLVVLAPPAEANPFSDAASTVYNTGKDVVETAAGFVWNSGRKVVMIAVKHPVVTVVVGGMIVATIAVPALLSVDGEVLATAETVETTEVVETSSDLGAEVGAEDAPTTDEVVGAARQPGFTQEDVTEERCQVAVGDCGKQTPKEEQAPRSELKNSDKEQAKKDAGCGTGWRALVGLPSCKSAGNGKYFREEDVHVDHIVPLNCGGNNSLANLQVLSAGENLAKGGTCLAE